MGIYAYAVRAELAMDANEIVLTKMAIGTHSVYVGVACLSMLLIWMRVGGTSAGWIYLLIGPLQFANGWYWGSQIRELRVNS